MDPRPVGVFDSGVGGLTVLHECLVTLPHEDFVYLGDHARLPYGPRPLPEIRRFAGERLPRYMVPTRFEIVDSLPRTPTGKIDRRRLAERLQTGA